MYFYGEYTVDHRDSVLFAVITEDSVLSGGYTVSGICQRQCYSSESTVSLGEGMGWAMRSRTSRARPGATARPAASGVFRRVRSGRDKLLRNLCLEALGAGLRAPSNPLSAVKTAERGRVIYAFSASRNGSASLRFLRFLALSHNWNSLQPREGQTFQRA